MPALKRIRFDRVHVSRVEHENVMMDDEIVSRKVRRDYIGDGIVFDMVGAPSLPAHAVSEGTVLVLALLTVVLGARRPNLVLIDGIDHGLHPKAQREFVSLIRTLLKQNADLQIVATTHSPYFLDCLEPKEVRQTALDEQRAASCRPLQDHPDFKKWKDEMTPGEFWSHIGE